MKTLNEIFYRESVPDVCLRRGPPLLNRVFFICSDSLCIDSHFLSLFHYSSIN